MFLDINGLQVEIYNPSSNKWSILNVTMQRGRAALGAAILNGKLYACGGDAGETFKTCSTVEVYDFEVKQ